jgi:AAA+ ATPase superfamily predicted ATPase
VPLFDLAPKESSSALHGRQGELDELTRLIEARRWVVVLGPRMVGKTSLVKAARNRLHRPGAYVNLWGVRTVQGLIEGLIAGMNESASLRARLVRAARRVDGISAGPNGLSLTAAHHPLKTAWALLDLLGTEAGDCLVVLDEVQELSSNSGALLKLLGNIFNTRPNVVFVFTGSLVGISKTLLDPAADSPLYGRSPASMTLGSFDRATSEDFLVRGSRAAGIQLEPSQLSSALDGPLNGTPGWLTLYGNHLTVGKLSPDRALAKTIEEGKKVAESEIEHFLYGRDPALYWPALKAMALGAPWGVVREYVSRSIGSEVNDAVIHRIVHALEASYLTKREEGTYRIEDPMVRAYVSGAKRPPRGQRTMRRGAPS